MTKKTSPTSAVSSAEQAEAIAAATAQGLDVPVLACRRLGDKLRLFLYGGRVLDIPIVSSQPTGGKTGRSKSKTAESKSEVLL